MLLRVRRGAGASCTKLESFLGFVDCAHLGFNVGLRIAQDLPSVREINANEYNFLGLAYVSPGRQGTEALGLAGVVRLLQGVMSTVVGHSRMFTSSLLRMAAVCPFATLDDVP